MQTRARVTTVGAFVSLLAHAAILIVLRTVGPAGTTRMLATVGIVAVVLAAATATIRVVRPLRAAGWGLHATLYTAGAALLQQSFTLTPLTPATETSFVWLAAAVPVIAITGYAIYPRARARLIALGTVLAWTVLLVLGASLADLGLAEAGVGPALIVVGIGAFCALTSDIVAHAARLAMLVPDGAHGGAHAASRDSLTGLVTRRAGAAILATLAEAGGAIGILSLDHRQAIDDTHGHGVSDVLLAMVAGRIAGAIRGQDTPVRWGADEFIVALPGADLIAAGAIAERLRTVIGEIRQPTWVTVSIGVATIDAGGDVTEALQRADDALYRAKATGRDRVALDGIAGPLADHIPPAPEGSDEAARRATDDADTPVRHLRLA